MSSADPLSSTNSNTVTDRQSSCFPASSIAAPSSSSSSSSLPSTSSFPTSAPIPCSTTGAAVNRYDRHALTQDPLDNHTLTSIVNSILHPATTAVHGEPHSAEHGDNEHSNNNNNNDDDNVVQQYLLPVDLVVSVDKSNKPTVKAALPSSFAFQQPLPLSFLSAYPPPMASMPTLTPQIAPITSLTSMPQMAQLPQLPSMPMAALPSPSIPLSVLMSQPQQMPSMPLAMPSATNSLLNPSAASFTPSLAYSAFAPSMPMTAFAPICEAGQVTQNKPEEEEMDAWCVMDENPEHASNRNSNREYFRPPRMCSNHSNDGQSQSQTADSFVYENNKQNNRQTWRNFSGGHKPHELDMNPIPPRWRTPQHQKERPMAKHLHISYRVNKAAAIAATDAVKSKPKLMAEFVEHVTLPNRENYPPDTIFTKTWAMKNSGELEWGYGVELVYVKGDENLSLFKRVPVINAQSAQTVQISATIKTPSIPGRYCTYFRLQKNGRFFGPRVWCDIIVGASNPNVAALEARVNAPRCANEVAQKQGMVNNDKILTQRAAMRWKKKYSAKNSQVPSYYKFVSCK